MGLNIDLFCGNAELVEDKANLLRWLIEVLWFMDFRKGLKSIELTLKRLKELFSMLLL